MRGAVWSIAGLVASRSLGLLSFVLVGRLLGKQHFGELGVVQSTVGVFTLFAGLGLGLTSTKYVAEFRANQPRRAGGIVWMTMIVACVGGMLMTALVWLLAPWLAGRVLANWQLSGVLQVGALTVFFTALNSAQTGALAGLESFKAGAQANTVAGILSFPIIVCGTYYGGLPGAVWGLVATAVLNCIFSHWALMRGMRYSGLQLAPDPEGQQWRVLFHFSLPAVFSSLVVMPTTWLGTALVVNQPGGYAQMGIYNAVLRVKLVPELLLGAMMAPLLPVLSESFAKKDVPSFERALRTAFIASLAVTMPLAFSLAALPELCLAPYGHDYLGHPGVVQWLMLHGLLVGLSFPVSFVLASMNRMWFGWVYNASWAVVYLALATILVPRQGAAGLAASMAMTHLVTAVPCVVYIYRAEPLFLRGMPLASLSTVVLALFGLCVMVSLRGSNTLSGLAALIAVCLCVGILVGLRRRGLRPVRGAVSGLEFE